MFFNRLGPNSQGGILFIYVEDWRSQISLYNSFKDTFEWGLGGRGFELTTSWVDFPFGGHEFKRQRVFWGGF